VLCFAPAQAQENEASARSQGRSGAERSEAERSGAESPRQRASLDEHASKLNFSLRGGKAKLPLGSAFWREQGGGLGL